MSAPDDETRETLRLLHEANDRVDEVRRTAMAHHRALDVALVALGRQLSELRRTFAVEAPHLARRAGDPES